MAGVLVGIDFTGEGRAALEAAIAEAARRDTELVLLHHVRLVSSDEGVVERRAEGQRLLDRAAAVAGRADLQVRTVLEFGTESAGTVLLHHAAELDADLIVIGTRKRTRVSKALMGSDAQQVVLGAHCQVLCVKDLFAGGPLLTGEGAGTEG